MPNPSRPPLVPLLTAALVVYTLVALVVAHRWISGLAAALVAVLLWRRHPRARLSAYVLLSAAGVRGLATGAWGFVLFALGAIALLQTPGARRAWPRLRPGGTGARADGDTMARP